MDPQQQQTQPTPPRFIRITPLHGWPTGQQWTGAPNSMILDVTQLRSAERNADGRLDLCVEGVYGFGVCGCSISVAAGPQAEAVWAFVCGLDDILTFAPDPLPPDEYAEDGAAA